jgi:FG-GAP-like repeat
MADHSQPVRWSFACLLLCLAVRAAAAQQFQEQVGLLPVPTNYWTEAVAAVDANEDGRWDVLFVHANGWAKPGDFHATGTFPLPPIVLVNHGTSSGNPVFADESATYLPVGLELHGKGAAVADFDGDGHDDLVIAVAFGGRQRLLIKQPTTLAWIDASTRLPPMQLNCFSAGVGDLDDDGDLDLVFTDAARPTFFAPGGKARLCINDGSGTFTEQPAWIGASNKVGAQNAKIVDLDNDFDLDVIVDGKSPRTQVYFNDGTAHFSEDDEVIPIAARWTYETEWGDLDNDDDIDGAIMSLGYFSEGAAQNTLSDSGALAFRATTDTMSGLPEGEFDDDNEFVFIDADDDNDLDVIVASLQNQQEKLFFNRGTFAPGFLQFTPGAGFSQHKDSTLDLCVADFDGDGDYDAVTGQGESFDFTDRYFRNVGPRDTLPPRIGRVESAPVTLPVGAWTAGGLVRHAWIQDATWDDGWTFETARLLFDTDKLGQSSSGAVRMRHSGGQIFRGVVPLPPCQAGLVGMRVSYRIQASDPNGNTSVSGSQTFVLCGSESYGPEGPIALTASADPTLGSSFVAQASGGPPGQLGWIAVGTARASGSGDRLLVDPSGRILLPVLMDGNGTANVSVPVPQDARLAGRVLDLQVVAPDPSQPRGCAVSNGLEIALCAP